MTRLASSFKQTSGLIRSVTPLTDDQIMNAAPSVFAVSAHESRSARYTYIPTVEILNGLRREGFQPFMVAQAVTRLEDRREFAKHMIRLRHADQINSEIANEIVLLNSHDGMSSYQMLAGCFRFVCQNGMVCGETIDNFRIRHSGNIVGNVIEGAFKVLDQFGQVDQSRETMRSTELKPAHQEAFARAALELRYDPENQEKSPIEPRQLNIARRFDDRGSDLWRTFNRVQENMIQGGIVGSNPTTGRRTTTREVKSVSENVRLNRALWTLSEEMARLAA